MSAPASRDQNGEGAPVAESRQFAKMALDLAPLLEPLLFAPAFLAVGWALLASRRRPTSHEEAHE